MTYIDSAPHSAMLKGYLSKGVADIDIMADHNADAIFISDCFLNKYLPRVPVE